MTTYNLYDIVRDVTSVKVKDDLTNIIQIDHLMNN